MESPYLVKQFLTSDTETGSFSKIYWLYKPRKNPDKIGLGFFFEVVSGDLEPTSYEYISRAVWDVFVDAYFKRGYENALKKASFTLLNLLAQLEVEEIDLNFGLFSIKRTETGYLVNLATFGQIDVILVRDGKYVDITSTLPENSDLKKLKYVEFDAAVGDVLFLANRYLVLNAMEAGIVKTDNINAILDSLAEFEKTLDGNKKIFVLGIEVEPAYEEETIAEEAVVKEKTLADKLKGVNEKFKPLNIAWGKFVSIAKKTGTFLLQKSQAGFVVLKNTVASKLKRSAATQSKVSPEQGVSFVQQGAGYEPGESAVIEADKAAPTQGSDQVVESPELPQQLGEDTVGPEFLGSERSEAESGKTEQEEGGAPQPSEPESLVESSSGEQSENLSSVVAEGPEAREGHHLFSSEQKVSPEKPVTEVLDASVKAHLLHDPVEEFKLRHSKRGKFVKILRGALGLVFLGLGGLSKIFHRRRSFKIQSHIPTHSSRKGLLVYAVGIGLIGVILWWVFSSYKAKKQEAKRTKDFIATEVTPVLDFYKTEIEKIKLEDKNHYLDLCFIKVKQAREKVANFKKDLKYEKDKSTLDYYLTKLEEVKNKCQAKYDRIYNIVRISNPELLKDFTAELGAKSNVVSLHIAKGYIYVVDQGKKAVYQVNPENGRVIKLEDPNGLVSEPVSVGANKDKILVCDKKNGVLEYANDKFKKIVGTEPSSIGASCAGVEGFYTNAYFYTEKRDKLYKSVGYESGSYALPMAYIKNLSKIRDVLIDGNIYVLREKSGKVVLERYFGGRYDPSFKMKERLGDIKFGYTNPAGNFPIYLYDASINGVRVVEKPTKKKHYGYGVIVKTYVFNTDKIKNVRAIAVDLSLRTNKENYLYILADNVLWRIRMI